MTLRRRRSTRHEPRYEEQLETVVNKGMTPDELWEELQPILADECDHGEDDPCRSETEGPAVR